MIYKIIKPILFLLPPEISHKICLTLLQFIYFLGIRFKIKKCKKSIFFGGIYFPNPIGLAAGLDKNADYIDALGNIGFGFIEVGTATPKKQKGNEKPRLFRIKSSESIFNQMGFNNKGIDYIIQKIKNRKYKGILGINIGKNSNTKIENAVNDYLFCYRKAFNYADYITINISSPNTKNIYDLQEEENLSKLLNAITLERKKLQKTYNRTVPLWIKISPNLNEKKIKNLSKIFIFYKIDAVIATNTLAISKKKINLLSKKNNNNMGGISGKFLEKYSNNSIRLFKKYLANKVSIVGVGGIDSKRSALKKIYSGADILQIYTGLIYQGPKLINNLVRVFNEL